MSYNGILYHLEGFLDRIALGRAPGKRRTFDPVAVIFRVGMENYHIFAAFSRNVVFSLLLHIDHLPLKFLYEIPEHNVKNQLTFLGTVSVPPLSRHSGEGRNPESFKPFFMLLEKHV